MGTVGLVALMTTFETGKFVCGVFGVGIGQNCWRVNVCDGDLRLEGFLDRRGVVVFDGRVLVFCDEHSVFGGVLGR
jgi:hypothetical protein